MSRARRPAVLATAVLLDLAAGDPPDRLHPVAWFGRLAKRWEQKAPSRPLPRLLYGALGAIVLPLAAGVWAATMLRRASGPPAFLLEALVLKSTFALRGLVRAVDAVAVALDAQDAGRARRLLPSLVSRDVQVLDQEQTASAAIESAAENVTDAFLAPWLFYALGGLPAAVGYRALNTLDSMWGYRTPEYEHFGKAAARLDDAANYLPATLAPRLMLAGRSPPGLQRARRAEDARAGWWQDDQPQRRTRDRDDGRAARGTTREAGHVRPRRPQAQGRLDRRPRG